MRGRLAVLLGYKRRKEASGDELSAFLQQLGPGFNQLWRAAVTKLHTGRQDSLTLPTAKKRSTPPLQWEVLLFMPTLLPINNSWWLYKPRGKVLVSVDMQFDLLLSGGKDHGKGGTP